MRSIALHSFRWSAVPLLWLAACGGLSPLGEDREVVFDSDTGTTGGDSDDEIVIPDTAAPDTDLDTGDSGTVTPALAWDTVGWTSAWSDAVSTNTTTGVVTISLDTVAVGGVAQLWIGDTRFTKDYDEEHTLGQTSADPSGQFASYARSLDCDATFGGQTSDVDTVFDCQDDGGGVNNDLAPVPNGNNYSVSYAAAVWAPGDTPGVDAPADCITFGRNGDLLLDSTWMAGTMHVPPSWLSAANCRSVP